MSEKKRDSQKKQNIIKRNIPVILAFILPVAVMLAVFIIREIYPFGDEMYLRSDMYHQYATFLKQFQTILKSGKGMIYTWNIGLGTDFLGTYAYYLASPVNWLVYFLPSDHIPEIMGGFIIIKAGLMSSTMAYYLKKHFDSKSYAVTAFGIFYGLSSYMAAYSWNLMWLDCLLLLPLIVLGLERLVKENRVSLYTITLAVSIISNYYISIMICIFLVLYFLYLVICEKREGKLFKVICRFAGYSLIAGGMACILLLPMMYTMMGSASNSFSFPTTVRWYFNFFEMISHAAMNVEPTVLSGYIPNIYCTVGVFMLIPMYLICSRTKIKERTGKCVLAGIFLVSFMMNITSYIWHGFHYPNSLSARQSFIYIFLILVMAFEAFLNTDDYSYMQIIICFAIGEAVLAAAQYVYGDSESYPLSATLTSCVFLALYCLIVILKKTGRGKKAAVPLLLIVICVCETFINTEETGYSTTNRTSYVSDNEAIETLLDSIDDDGFYRVEKVKRRTKNDGAWSDYMSASLFSSSARAAISDFYEQMGMQSSMNSYSYYGHTPVMTAILGVKYELSASQLTDSLMTEYAYSDDMYLYENEYALSLGFAVSSELAAGADTEISDPFEAQNAFVENACGVSDVFTGINEISGSSILINVTHTGRQYMYIEESAESVYVTVERDGEVIFESEYTDLENPQLVEICDVEEGDVLVITVTDDEVSTITVHSAVMDYDAFEEAMVLLADEQYDISEFSETYVCGSITVSEDCYMFTSVPAEYGWKVYVDGQETEYETYDGAFIMIALSEGEHTVEFRYVPTGLYFGIIFSLISLVIFVLCMIRRRVSKAKETQPPQPPAPAGPEIPESVEDDIVLQLDELFLE